MRHPSEGTLRRLVDEPDGVADPDREHVASCPECLSGLAAAQEDAALTAAALDLEVTPDVDSAWQRLSAGAGAGVVAVERPRALTPTASRRWRAALRSPAVAAVGVAALVAGAGAAAAADWLPIFRTQRVAAVSITEADLVDLPDLAAYGDVQVVDVPHVHQVGDAAQAEKATGLSVPQVSELPRGVTGDRTFQVGDQLRVLFTFSADKAARAAARAGDDLPTPPPGLDGSQFRLTAGPGLASVWSASSGLPALVVARAVAPAGDSSGIPFDTARDYLLSLPGMPERVADQLRTLSDDGSTLPLPLPADQVTSSTADVGGVPGTVFRSKDGTMAGVVWVKDGVVTAVAGTLSTDEVLSVARGLR
jgi:hypothetical protein